MVASVPDASHAFSDFPVVKASLNVRSVSVVLKLTDVVEIVVAVKLLFKYDDGQTLYKFFHDGQIRSGNVLFWEEDRGVDSRVDRR